MDVPLDAQRHPREAAFLRFDLPNHDESGVPRWNKVNVAIMRAFVRLRELLLTNADLAHKLAELERKYDAQFKVVFDAIRQLMSPEPQKAKPEMGFHVREDVVPYRIRKQRGL